MRNISIWAKSHPWSARILIVLLYIPLNLAAIQSGNLLFDIKGTIPGSCYLLLILVTISAVTIYHTAGMLPSKDAYRRRTLGHFLLIAATFGLICVAANRMNDGHYLSIIVGRSAHAASSPSSHLTKKPPLFKSMGRKQVKQIRRYFIKTIRHTKALSKDEKVLLMIVTIVGAVGLGALLAGLSCSLACSGSEALAIVVLVLGAAGIALGVTMLVRHIFHHPTRIDPPSTRKSNNETPSF